MLNVGDVVTFYDPGGASGHESWQRGRITQTVLQNGGYALHVCALDAHKWYPLAEWGTYDGVPHVLGREVPGLEPGATGWADSPHHELQFVKVWNGKKPGQDLIPLLVAGGLPGIRQLGRKECSTIIGALVGGLYTSGLAAPETLRATLLDWAENETMWELLRRAAPGMSKVAVDAVEEMKGGRR